MVFPWPLIQHTYASPAAGVPSSGWYQFEFTISRSTDFTSTDLVSAKGKTTEVYCCAFAILCYSLVVLFWSFYIDVSEILMREGLQCRISILKHCLMRLWNDISQLTFVFPFAKTRSIKRMWCQLTERIWADRPSETNIQTILTGWAWAKLNGASFHICL